MSRGSLARLGLLALIWGSSFTLIKIALEGLSPIQIVLVRLVTAAVVLLLIVRLRRLRLPRERGLWAHLAVLGIVANIVPFFLIGWGEQRITSGLAGVLNGTTPLFTMAFAAAALPEERLHRLRAVGLLIGFLGVVLVVGPWDQNPLTSSLPGQLACLGASACYGTAFVYTRRFVAGRHPPMVLAAAQITMAAALLTLLAPVVARTPVTLSPSVVASGLLLGAFGTGAAYLLYYRLVTDAGATSASMVTYLIPVVAVTLGVVALAEPVTWNLFAGAAVVIAGVATAEGRIPGLRTPATAGDAPALAPEPPR